MYQLIVTFIMHGVITTVPVPFVLTYEHCAAAAYQMNEGSKDLKEGSVHATCERG